MPRDETGRHRRPASVREKREALGLKLASQLEDARRDEAEFSPLLLTTFRLELDPRGIRHARVEPTTFDHEDLARVADLVWEVEDSREDLIEFLETFNEEVETEAWVYGLDGDGELIARRREPEPAHNLRVFSIN